MFLKTELGGLDGLFDDVLSIIDFTEEQKKKVKLFITLLDKKQDRWITNDAGMLGFIAGIIIYSFAICPNITERLCELLESAEKISQENGYCENDYLNASNAIMDLKKIHDGINTLPIKDKSATGKWIELDGVKLLSLEYETDLPEGFNLRYGSETLSQ